MQLSPVTFHFIAYCYFLLFRYTPPHMDRLLLNYNVVWLRQVSAILLLCLLMLFIAGCQVTSDLGRHISDISRSFKGIKTFYQIMGDEYKALAEYEENVAERPNLAAVYQERVEVIEAGQIVVPLVPATRNVPEYALAELEEARASLIGQLTQEKTDDNLSLLAMAQTRYECWLLHREMYPEKQAHIACRDQYYDVMRLLSQQDGHFLRTYSIYFERGKAILDEPSFPVVRHVADAHMDRPQAVLVLNGYTDSIGNAYENKVLALRRAMAVKNSLIQHGVDRDNIYIVAKGEQGIPKSDDENGDEELRRVDIVFHAPHDNVNGMKSIADIPGWGNLDTQE